MEKSLPRHIAIIMDGNGRWATQRKLPRIAGHKAGIEAVRRITKACSQRHIEVLTLFAFSSENWQRPRSEVNQLMQLFLFVLQQEINQLHQNNVQIRFIGDYAKLNEDIQCWIQTAHQLTQTNTGLKLVIALNYGGRWDIAHAFRKVAQAIELKKMTASAICPELIASHLTTADLPEPDLFIRTSGEQRISNFLIWQLAYTELYFTDILWPDFDEKALEVALEFFATRDRRFGTIHEQ